MTVSEPNWKRFDEGGHSIGSPEAPVNVIVFSDFQCPFCKEFSASWAALHRKYANQVRLVFHHYPLVSIHPFARDAALLADCVGSRGHFADIERVLFANQDSLTAANWEWLADQAGVSDSAWVRHCVQDSVFVGQLLADEKLGQAVPVKGTPTVFVNEWKVIGTPSWAVLDSLTKLELRRHRLSP